MPTSCLRILRSLVVVAVVAASAQAATPPSELETTGRLATQLGLEEGPRSLRDMFPDWRTPAKIIVNVGRSPERLEFMRQAAPAGLTLIAVANKASALEQLHDAEGLIGSQGWCDPDVLAAGKKLRWIHVSSAGVNECALAEIRKRNIVLTNHQRVQSSEVAEHAFALILALSRGLDSTLELQRQGRWRTDAIPHARLRSLNGHTLLVVGLGGIGTQIAERAHAMDMRVIAIRNSSREGPDFVEYVGLAHELPDLIARADVVVNVLPLTQQTRGLFNRAMFERMRKDAYYINAGRGGTTVTDDLLAVLKEGRIAGAGLDVTEPEPLPDGHPLWRAPNLILTPHIATDVQGSGGERSWIIRREQLRRFIAGERLFSIVDLDKGY
jgi:phosphoglycerate dehydrogenase-like enzyme